MDSKHFTLDDFRKQIEIEEEEQYERPRQSYGSDTSTHPYLSITLVGRSLSAVSLSGNILFKADATYDDYKAAKAATSEIELLKVFQCKEVAPAKVTESELKIAVANNMTVLSSLSLFEVKDGCIYLKGINRSLPALLADRFITIAKAYNYNEEAIEEDDEFLGLKRFFMWCCLNPRAEVADDLYGFLVKNSFRITKQGFFVALRNVVTVAGESTKLVQFVSNAYNKIKAVWKKNPENYVVLEDASGYSLYRSATGIPSNSIGNLATLYKDLPNMLGNHFTDAHTGTFDIRIGKVVSMPPEECSWSRADCAEAGLAM